jgi:hypothetical protein
VNGRSSAVGEVRKYPDPVGPDWRADETYHRAFALHDCSWPVTDVAGTHLCQSLPNAMIPKSVRSVAVLQSAAATTLAVRR